MTTPTLSFVEFQRTQKPCDDLGAALSDEALANQPGLLYCDCLYIETATPHWTNPQNLRYHLLLGRDDWLSNNLEDLERKLYRFAVDEGYCAAPITTPNQIGAKRIADAFRKIYSAAMVINEVLGDNEDLNTTVPSNWPLHLSADEFAAECSSMIEHYQTMADQDHA